MSYDDKIVLVLEDQPLIALDIEYMLTHSGFKNVSVISSCADAEKWLESNLPDVALLDINLRDGACFGIAETLVENRIPFVVHSGSNAHEVEETSVFHKGKWITKPSHPDHLLAAICDALS